MQCLGTPLLQRMTLQIAYSLVVQRAPGREAVHILARRRHCWQDEVWSHPRALVQGQQWLEPLSRSFLGIYSGIFSRPEGIGRDESVAVANDG